MRYKDNKKQFAIYNSVMEIACQQGFNQISMSKVAKAAGVSASTLYVYFENKEDMLIKVYQKTKQELTEQLFQEFADDISPRLALALYMRNLFYFIQKNGLQFSYQEQFERSPQFSTAFRSIAAESNAPLLSVFARAVREQVIKDYPLALNNAYISEPILGLARAYRNQKIEVNEQMLQQAISMSWKAIKH